jgi:WD40 repeat protein
VWDVQSGEVLALIQSIEDFPGPIGAFSPDGQLVATSTVDFWYTPTVRVWDVNSGAELYTFKNGRDFAFSSDGTVLAIVDQEENSIHIWDVVTHAEVRTFTDPRIAYAGHLAFSPDGKLLAMTGQDIAGNGAVWLWDMTSGNVLETMQIHLIHLNVDLDILSSVAFSPDSSLLVLTSPDQTVRLLNVISGVDQQAFQDLYGVFSIEFSADGNQLAMVGGHRSPVLWVGTLGTELQAFPGFYSHGFGVDGTVLLIIGGDEVQLWDTTSYTVLANLTGAKNPTFSPDGNLIAASGPEGEVQLWGIE